MMNINIGLCTIALSSLSMADALTIAGDGDARVIEVWGREHLPADATPAATTLVRRLAEGNGLRIAAYGSYARAGGAEWTPAAFASMLERAADLGAPLVRVWAGEHGSAEAPPEDWQHVADSLRAWGDLAAARGLQLVVERHCHTLTDYGDTAQRLLAMVDHPAVRLNYQVPYPLPAAAYRTELAEDLRRYLPMSGHIHVQNYAESDGNLTITHVGEGIIDYAAWRPLLAEADYDGCAMLEFLPAVAHETDLIDLVAEELATLRAMWSPATSAIAT